MARTRAASRDAGQIPAARYDSKQTPPPLLGLEQPPWHRRIPPDLLTDQAVVRFFKVVLGGTPRWTRPSTKATCQPEKPESSQVKTWGSASTLGVELGHPRCLSSNRSEPVARKNVRNVADTGTRGGGCCCQQNGRFELGQKKCGSIPTCHRVIHRSLASLCKDREYASNHLSNRPRDPTRA